MTNTELGTAFSEDSVLRKVGVCLYISVIGVTMCVLAGSTASMSAECGGGTGGGEEQYALPANTANITSSPTASSGDACNTATHVFEASVIIIGALLTPIAAGATGLSERVKNCYSYFSQSTNGTAATADETKPFVNIGADI